MLERLDPAPEPNNTLACPDLLPVYSDDTVEETFDPYNIPTPAFLLRVRGFISDLITLHFRHHFET